MIPSLNTVTSAESPVTRGSLYDVLDRYYQTASQAKAEVVVRITADCPVIDPELIDNVVNTLLEDEYDFVCNRLPPPWHRTYPIGLDVEVCTFEALKQAWQEAKEPQQREHAMPYFYEGVQLDQVNRNWNMEFRRVDLELLFCITPPTSAIIAGRSILPRIWSSCSRFILTSMDATTFHGRKSSTWFMMNLN